MNDSPFRMICFVFFHRLVRSVYFCLMLVHIHLASSECPKIYCFCYSSTVECRNHGRSLSYIPKINGTVKKLVFVNNYLPRVTRDTFTNISAAQVSHLNLTQNGINAISKDAFADFVGFYVLDLSSNIKLSLDMLSITFANTRFLQQSSLYLNNVSSSGMIQKTVFQNLTDSKLRKISLQLNNLLLLDGNIFRTLKFLHELDLSNNRISVLNLEGLNMLTRLYLNQNNLEIVPVFHSINRSRLIPRLKLLHMNNNKIKILKTKDFYYVKRLNNLGILNNPIYDIQDNVFSSLRKLRNIRILPSGRSLKQIASYAFNTTNAYKINLADALFKFRNDHFDPDNIFRHCPRLRVLILSYNSVPHDPIIAIKMFGSLTQLRQLTLQSVGWTYIPHGLFHRLRSLEKLELDTNYISSVSLNNPFLGLKTLRYLGLASNKLNTIAKDFLPTNFLENLNALNLARNPFTCDCQIRWFVDWLNKTTIRLPEYSENYICVTPSKWKGKLLSTFHDDCSNKKNYTIIVVVASCSSFLVVMILLTLLTYKLRWHIRYWIYVLYGKRTAHSGIECSDNKFLYDGFVVYCDSDRKWVHDYLISFLENEYGYKLCIHYRDFLLGNLIVDNIIDNMKCSRKIVLIVSNAFCKSKWCQFEILMAHERLLDHGENVLVTILLEDVKSKYLTNTLKHILSTTTYAAWTEDSNGMYVFWEHIKNAFQNRQ